MNNTRCGGRGACASDVAAQPHTVNTNPARMTMHFCMARDSPRRAALGQQASTSLVLDVRGRSTLGRAAGHHLGDLLARAVTVPEGTFRERLAPHAGLAIGLQPCLE